MSGSEDSFALVPAGIQSNQGTQFSQQGNIDWVALGQTQFSASIAILGRLSSAGIEPLTVAVGQAICSKVPLGVHGEKVLAEAMSKLQACSSFGDVIWFGVGVKHILRILVQTSQGAALVALCAALREAHNLSTSALIMFEMAKSFEGPRDLSPSFAQWEALIKVCSSVFAGSTLGLRIHQLMKLGDSSASKYISCEAGHPKDLAEIILAVGKVSTGVFQEIKVRGGPACSWIAAFADHVLGLRVLVRSQEGSVIFTNFDIEAANAQVNVEFCNDLSSEGIICTGRVFAMRQGNDFIHKCFVPFASISPDTFKDDPYLGGRVNWDTMLQDAFGRDAKDILEPQPGALWKEMLIPHHVKLNEVFIQFYVAGAAIYTFSTPEICRYRNPADFILSNLRWIPELCQIKSKLLETAAQFDGETSQQKPFHRYLEARQGIRSMCGCREYCRSTRFQNHQGVFCLMKIADTILLLSFLLGRLSLHDCLSPKRSGLMRFYETFTRTDLDSLNYDSLNPEASDVHGVHKASDICDLVRVHLRVDIIQLSTYITLFSGVPPPRLFGISPSAMSDGMIYCFIDTVQSLSDRFEKASIIHVGAGSIQVGHRLHAHVSDKANNVEVSRGAIPARKVEVLPDGLLTLTTDTSSTDLQIEAMVEDSVHLSFWYRITSGSRDMLLSPAAFVRDLLYTAAKYKLPELLVGSSAQESLSPKLLYTIVHGEGYFGGDEAPGTRIIVRPHIGNLLGRCVALLTSPKPVALLNSAEDLATFIKVWNLEDAHRYTIIS